MPNRTSRITKLTPEATELIKATMVQERQETRPTDFKSLLFCYPKLKDLIEHLSIAESELKEICENLLSHTQEPVHLVVQSLALLIETLVERGWNAKERLELLLLATMEPVHAPGVFLNNLMLVTESWHELDLERSEQIRILRTLTVLPENVDGLIFKRLFTLTEALNERTAFDRKALQSIIHSCLSEHESRFRSLPDVLSDLESLANSTNASTARLTEHVISLARKGDALRFGFLIQPSADAITNAIQHARLRKLIRNFTYVFTAADPVVLRVASVEDEDWSDILNALDRNHNSRSAPVHIEIIPRPLTKAQLPDFFASLTNDLSADKISLERLFEFFQNHEKGNNNCAFENNSVINAYDLDYITAQRRNNKNFFGSVVIDPASFISARNQRNLPNYKSILDVGCGSGAFYGILKKIFSDSPKSMPLYSGIDVSRNQVMRARQTYPDGHFIFGDAARLPYPDHVFDLVTANSVLNFLSIDDQWRALDEIIRVANKGICVGVSCRIPESRIAIPPSLQVCFGNEKTEASHYANLADLQKFLSSKSDIKIVIEYQQLAYDPIERNLRKISEKQRHEILTHLDAHSTIACPNEGDVLTIQHNDFPGKIFYLYECVNLTMVPSDWEVADGSHIGSLWELLN